MYTHQVWLTFHSNKHRASCRYSKLTCVKYFFVCAVVVIEMVRSSCFSTNLRQWTTLWVTSTAVTEAVPTIKILRWEAGKKHC